MKMNIWEYLLIAVIIVVLIFLAGIRIVRPTNRGLIETMGKYTKFATPGFHWVFPKIQKIYLVNVTEQMFNAEPQVIITNDNLNATVDAQVYFRVKFDEESVKTSNQKLQEEITRVSSIINDVEIIPSARRGIPYDEIIKLQEEKNIDLIVIASHGKTGILKNLIGSVSEKVVRTAKCPVMVVRS